jgi:hypothetical protein
LTQTIQPLLPVSLNKEEKNQTISELDTEDNMSLFLHIFDDLNNLYEKLRRIDYLIERKNIELIVKKHGINKENT